jgi:hypothetical protein
VIPLHRFVPIIGLAAALWLVQPGDAVAQYDCGSVVTGHCYGVAIWEEQPQYYGAYADIPLVPSLCTGCDGFTTNELWVVDNASPGCLWSPRHKCWIEAGYFTWNGAYQDPVFFWADASPDGQFRATYLDRAPTWSENHFMLVQDARDECPGPFRAYIYNTSLTTLYRGQSSSFSANRVIVGQELSGTTGIFTATTFFTRNIWAVRPLGPEYVFWYAPQTTTGEVRSEIPPRGWWSILPADPLGPEGGAFASSCCH